MSVPLRCTKPPAPDAVINLVKCGCKTGCVRNCSCKKNGISCTELCKCFDDGCLNEHTKVTLENDSSDDENNDELALC